MSGGHLERLEAMLRHYREDDDAEMIDAVGDDRLTVGMLRAAVDELKRLRAERGEAQGALAVAAELIDRLSFDDECEYDHNGYCQAHNLHGRPCPHPLGRQFVAAWRAVEADAAPQQPERGGSGCPCGCPVVEGMCSCHEPCPCEPDCAYCLVPNPMREPERGGDAT